MMPDMFHEKHSRIPTLRCFLTHRAMGWAVMILVYLLWAVLMHWGH